MTFDDRAFEFIAWAQPLSDPRKARITVKQILYHTSGICPEATGAPIDGKRDFILGHTDDARTASLAFDPGTGCGYSSLCRPPWALLCRNGLDDQPSLCPCRLERILIVAQFWLPQTEDHFRYAPHLLKLRGVQSK
jgi:hypothetical protein